MNACDVARHSIAHGREVVPTEEVLRLVAELSLQSTDLPRGFGHHAITLDSAKIGIQLRNAECHTVRRLGIEEQEAPHLSWGQRRTVDATIVLK